MAGTWENAAVAIRPGEALDLPALHQWISTHLPDVKGLLSVRQYPSGFSNLTYALTIGGRRLILRRPPFGSQVATAHDMSREFCILSGLHPVWPKVPKPVAFCDDASVLGAPFYVMERLDGHILRGTRATGTTPAMMAALSTGLIDELADLHAVDVEAAGLASLGRPKGYVTRQIQGWSKRWRAACDEPVPQLDTVARWLLENLPAEAGASIIHNDFKYDNLVLSEADPTQIVGVLDWEMATLGCPLMDLGTALGYWIEPGELEMLGRLPFGPTAMPGNLSREALVLRYSERSGLEISQPLFYYLYGVFKVAVILEQIHQRYREGKTADPRFAPLHDGVKALAHNATRALESGRISDLW